MRDNKKIIVALIIAVVILIGLILTLIMGGEGSDKEPSITPTITTVPTDVVTPTASSTPVPTKKPVVAWQDKPTITPSQPNVTITEIPKPTPTGGVAPTPTDVPGWTVVRDVTPTPVVNQGTGLDASDYVTKDEDGTIHMNTGKYLEDKEKKNSEHSSSQ